MQDTFKDALALSKNFFRSHDLGELSDALPKKLAFNKDAQPVIDNAQRAGLTSSFLFPPFNLLQEYTEQLVSKLAASPHSNLKQEHQYAEPWIQDMKQLADCAARQRGDSPYLLLYGSGKFPDQTRNLTADQLDKMFAENGWTGVAAQEYLVLQRVASVANGDHRFDDYVSDVQRSQWMWLLDSRVPKGVVMGYWNPSKSRVEIGWCKSNNKNERRGAHPTVVIPVK